MLNQELLNYISQARQSGKTDDQIRQELLGSGWGEDAIKEAMSEKDSDHKSFDPKNVKGFFYIFVLSIGIGFLWTYFLPILTFLLASFFSDETTLFGIPAGLLPAIYAMQYITAFLIFPFSVFLLYKIYKKTAPKLNVNVFSGRSVIIIGSIILGIVLLGNYALYYGRGLVNNYRYDKAEEEFQVSAKIIDEKIIAGTRYDIRKEAYIPVYEYKIIINNETTKTHSLLVEVVPGKFSENENEPSSYLFSDPGGDRFSLELKPGGNEIQGSYELVSNKFGGSKSDYPTNGKIPISIRIYNWDIYIDKTIYIYSELPEWKGVFE